MSMRNLFDTPVDRLQTASQKWDRYQGQDILPMWVADTDFRAPQAVMDALHQRISHGVFGYTLAPESLNQTIIERMARLYDWQIEADWIVYLPGLVCGLNVATRSLASEGAGVITPVPVYPPFMSSVLLSKRKLLKTPMLLIDGRWQLDLDELRRQAADAELLLLCNPHNPGGTVYTRDELEAIRAVAEEFQLTVCSDDIHCDLLLDEDAKHVPFASLNDDAAQRTVTLMAPSKTFNIAGLACSFAIIPNPELRQKFIRAKRGIVPDINLLGYTAAEAAYRDGDEWLSAQLDYLRGNRDRLQQAIAGMPGLSLAHIEATYLAWIDASELQLDCPHQFFEKAGVGLSPGRDFGAPSFIRLNFGCTHATLEQAIKRMQVALAER
ncbi:putative C-S lyase [Corallincola luteus]|uniref:cysteine-S-conjugate beta-lyase n=3 Tax=Psychromonadaceae TaxID=267894 RepID=A0ABY1WP99_9GAMM|nr:putative C-S lyase [Corallincola spongiicola]TCI04013.1 putative C-S lyase [Corallincola luteus]